MTRNDRALAIAMAEGFEVNEGETFETAKELYFNGQSYGKESVGLMYSAFNRLMPILVSINSKPPYSIDIMTSEIEVEHYVFLYTGDIETRQSYKYRDVEGLIDCLQEAIIDYYKLTGDRK